MDEIRVGIIKFLTHINVLPGWDYIQCEVLHDYGHAFPRKDSIRHVFDDDGECLCAPLCEPVPRQDGSVGWFYLHNAMDGRG